MNIEIGKRPLWLLLGLLGLVVFTACSAALGSPAVEPAPPTDEPDDTETEDVQAAPSEPVDEPAISGSAQENDVNIMTEDNRSQRLRSLTATWNTNWNRHTVPYDELLSGGPPRDGIQSIDDPSFVSNEEAADWLAPNEPVIALELNGDARAYPLSIITWHEIVNDVVGGEPVAVTFCPLCNSALVFESTINGQVFEFGVSGLLRNSDLIMYDRTTETLWQQFTGEGIVGDLAGERLSLVPSSLVSFADFREGHPDGQVLSQDTGFNRPYGQNPYAGYDTYDHVLSAGGNLVLFREQEDDRLDAAARVVTVSLDEAGIDIAYPLTVLEEQGVIHDTQGGRDLVVFFKAGTASALGDRIIANAEDVGATGVFDPTVDGQTLTFSKEGDNFVDEQTGSTWNILGQAIAGPLAGQELEPIVHGDHFWFSWAAFKPDTIIYAG